MPTYDYTCELGHELEVTHSVHQMPTVPCPSCAKEMKKKITIPAIAFRGKGFYTTDKGS